MEQKLICFDVDGVLVNTNDEILVSSWNEYNLWLKSLGLPHSPFTSLLKDIPEKWLDTRSQFSRLASKAYHRVAINPMILSGFKSENLTAALIDELSGADKKLVEECVERVKQVRKKLVKSDGYKNLIKSMPEVDYDWIREKHDEGLLIFITNNPFSIVAFGKIAFEPDPDKIRSITSGVHDKATHIKEFEKTIKPERVLFVDDKKTSLNDVSKGTRLPKKNIIQNIWGEPKRAEGFNQMSFSEIKTWFDNM